MLPVLGWEYIRDLFSVPLLFNVALENLSREFREGMPMELFYANDLVLMADSEELLMEKLRKWKTGMEAKGLIVNAGNKKVMQCRVSRFQSEDSGEHPCGVRRKGVSKNSILCLKCLKWVHQRCSGISGKLKSNVDFHCRRCLEGENGLCQSVLLKEVVIEPNVKLECVPKFCYFLFGRYTWCGRRHGGGGKSQSKMCLG